MNEHLFGIQAVDNEIEWINEAKDNLLKKTHTQFTTGCSSLNQNDTGPHFLYCFLLIQRY